MLAVPEVDDDIDNSPSQETSQPPPPSQAIQTEVTTNVHPSPPATVDTADKVNIKTATSTPPSQQHRSRFGLFHRNTIHVCDRSSDSPTSHHSAPPTHYQTPKTGLDAINETVEDQSTQIYSNQARFPRSSTVPYPAYATLRRTAANNNGYFTPTYYYYADYPTLIHDTGSPTPLNSYLLTRQPLSSINTNFQPISPHHHQYSTRPVDVLKPTFLLVPKAAEQKLAAQLSANNSPALSTRSKTKRTEDKSVKQISSSPAAVTVRSVEVQTNSDDPQQPAAASPPPMTTTTQNIGYRHVGLLATPNPSPYVYFGSSSYSTQSLPIPPTGPPETSIIQEEVSTVNNYPQGPTPISLVQASPHQIYGSPNSRHYHLTQVSSDEQQQQLTDVDASTKSPNGQTRPETDELSLASVDLIDVPGSWRYRSVPIRTVGRRQRAPLPQSFLDSQQYASDSEPVVQSSSYRQQAMFGSIPTIHRPFDSIRSQTQVQFIPSIRLNEIDLIKIAAFYRSMGTLVYVARTLATLYSSDFDAMANLKDWKKLYTGVPIWLFNTGMNPKRSRCIRLIISEFGSSFTLWDTIVNGASDVRLPKPRHITLKSLETGTILALKFDDLAATEEFHQYFVKLSCDPRNADLFDLFNVKRRRRDFNLRTRKIKKSAISKPSQFNHINKVDEHDRDSLFTFSVLVDENNLAVN